MDKEVKTPKYDKTLWGDGPWQTEPDRKEWIDPATGLTCLIVRGPVGALCGYVGVPDTHPAHGLHYDGITVKVAEAHRKRFKIAARLHSGGADLMESFKKAYEGVPDRTPVPGIGDEIAAISVHGGLTYADECDGFICHTPKPGEPDNLWWFGFDCAHAWDYTPKLAEYRATIPGYPTGGHEGDVYRDIPYVESECANLARQLAAMTKQLPAPDGPQV